jgi:hypothetical protein
MGHFETELTMTDTADTGAGQQQGGAQQQSAPWHQGLIEPEVLGHAQNKGWDVSDPGKFAAAAAKAHMGAERLIGAPADQVLRLPKDANDKAGWNGVWTRLGRPPEAAGYDFAEVKHADGTAISPELDAAIRNSAFDAGLSKDGASAVAKSVVKQMDDARKTAESQAQAKIAEEKQALDKNWGANRDANLFLAKQAAQKLSIDPEAIAALEKMDKVGYAKVMEMFRDLGVKMGEARFITGGNNPNNPSIMSVDQAKARKSELLADSVFQKKYLAGDSEARREMTSINTIIAGGSVAA